MVVNILAKTTENLGGAFSPERLEYALQMTLLGMGAVFAVLSLIWLVLVVFKFFLYDLKNRDTKKQSTAKAPVVEKEVQPVVSEAPVVNSSDDVTVAAIIAAISAYISDDPELSKEYTGGFRVVSFKRTRAKATWNNENK